jgi:hypothetical protein
MDLVKFAAVGGKKEISDYYWYVESILSNSDELKNKVENEITIYTQDEYPNTVFCSIEEESFIVDVIFDFSSFESEKHLTIDITSDNYKLDTENSYIENLKLGIKKAVAKDWRNIVWFFDEDAFLLSEDLYGRFYTIENKIRRFINEYMLKTIGINWWEIISESRLTIEDKYKARCPGYKKTVSGFNNIDDHLMAIDVKDLYEILTMKRMEWKPAYDPAIEALLVGVTRDKEHQIIEMLKKQLTVKEDFKKIFFQEYLESDFFDSFKEFESSRNHVAHNKILDRTSYKKIHELLDKMDKYIEGALRKLYTGKKSLEQKQEAVRKYKELLLEVKQNDSGVNIREAGAIIEKFGNALEGKTAEIIDALRYREDINISEMKFKRNINSGELFSVVSSVTNEKLDFYYLMDIVDSEGSESTLTISCVQEPIIVDELDASEGNIVISYFNGEVSYDDGYYTPIVKDGIPDYYMKNYLNVMVKFILAKLKP